MKCTVCNHSQRHDIDQALLAGNATFAALSQQYGLSVSALFRHKKLLKLKMAQVEKDLANNLRQATLFQFNDFLEQTKQLTRTAGAAGNISQALQAVRVGTRILNFITKLDVQLDQGTVYRVLASPQWAAQDSLLPTDSNIITDAHQALADDLFFPCQELPAALEDDLKEEEISEISPLQTRKPELATLPKIQREISAKLPKKSPHSDRFNKQYQSNKRLEKNTAKNSSVSPAKTNELRQTANSKRKTVFEKLATHNPNPETLFQRLCRKWLRIGKSLNYYQGRQNVRTAAMHAPSVEIGRRDIKTPIFGAWGCKGSESL